MAPQEQIIIDRLPAGMKGFDTITIGKTEANTTFVEQVLITRKGSRMKQFLTPNEG